MEKVLGYPVTDEPLNVTLKRCFAWLQPSGRARFIACANPHSLVVARSDSLFRDALRGADLLVPDGAGIVLASRVRRGNIRGRITGSDLFEGLSRCINDANGPGAENTVGTPRKPYSVFLLGASSATLDKMAVRLKQDFPHLVLAGVLSPPFRTEFTSAENDSMVEQINAADADLLWVGMTAPKQEKWIHWHKDRLNVRLAVAIGAVFDFYAGNIKRSPRLFQHLGLEWLPRLAQEPRRLWRRNLNSLVFLANVLTDLCQQRNASPKSHDC